MIASALRTSAAVTICLVPFLAGFADDPSWWLTRQAITAPGEDRMFAVQGQAKHVAYQAYEEFDEMLAPLGGVGTPIRNMIESEWFKASTSDSAVLRIGQLKTLAAPFYKRLAELNITPGNLQFHESLPWDVHLESTEESENAIAVVGQIKQVFSFDLDTDADGLPDWWERRHWGNLDQAGSDDSDDDGVANADEFKKGTNPLSADTDGDGHLDAEDEDPATALSQSVSWERAKRRWAFASFQAWTDLAKSSGPSPASWEALRMADRSASMAACSSASVASASTICSSNSVSGCVAAGSSVGAGSSCAIELRINKEGKQRAVAKGRPTVESEEVRVEMIFMKIENRFD